MDLNHRCLRMLPGYSRAPYRSGNHPYFVVLDLFVLVHPRGFEPLFTGRKPVVLTTRRWVCISTIKATCKVQAKRLPGWAMRFS